MRCRLVLGVEQAARCSRTKSQVRRDGSKQLRLAGGVNAKSFIGQRIELAGFHIDLELTVPGLCVERRIPPTKCRKLSGRKLLNLLFNCFYVAHTSPYLLQNIRRAGRPAEDLSSSNQHDGILALQREAVQHPMRSITFIFQPLGASRYEEIWGQDMGSGLFF